jgi:serine/threonine protein kinase
VSCLLEKTRVINRNTDLLEGKRISQRFRIKVVEQWHEHAVFCTGEDLERNRQVCLVLIDPLAVKSAEAFEKTAKRKQKLRHANLVALEDFGQTCDGEPFVALDRFGLQELEGTLDKKAALPVRNACEVVLQLIEGLSFLAESHEPPALPLPDRILVCPDEQKTFKILDLDFGESLAEKDLLVQRPLSALQAASFTPPECVKGKEVDARSQVYALGCLIYRLVTGVAPFESDDLVELQSQQLCVAPRRFHEARPDLYLPPRLEACVMKALSKDPAARPASLRQFLFELKDALKAQSWWQKNWRQVACLAAVCAGAGLYAGGYLGQPFWQTLPPAVSPPPVENPPVPAGIDSMLPPLPANAVKLGKLNLSGSNQKTLLPGNYQCDELNLSDSARLTAQGDVSLWITPAGENPAAFTISGQAQLAALEQSEKLKIYYSGSSIVMSGMSSLKATVQAPVALLDASGDSAIEGSFTSAGQRLNDKAHFVGAKEE